jgi:hypothetical protein
MAGGVHGGENKATHSFQIEMFLHFFLTLACNFCDLNHAPRDHPLLAPYEPIKRFRWRGACRANQRGLLRQCMHAQALKEVKNPTNGFLSRFKSQLAGNLTAFLSRRHPLVFARQAPRLRKFVGSGWFPSAAKES